MDETIIFLIRHAETINENSISIVIASNDHDKEKANKIIRSIQNLYEEEKYITVKYNS